MNSSYTNVLNTAKDALSRQDFPISALFMVASPIGNLADISLRALYTLSLCDFLACEDTRESKNLLQNYGIDKPTHSWIAVHQHNEADQCPLILSLLAQGKRVAFLCDAGTPGVSDPGAWLVKSVTQAGFRVVPIPGASSLTTIVSVCGLTTQNGFNFLGFLPSKGAERSNALNSLALQPRATVLMEAPHRIEALAASLSALGSRKVTLGRELTKQFEEIVTLEASQITSWLNTDCNKLRGEFVIVLHAEEAQIEDETAQYSTILTTLLEELTVKTAVRVAQQLTKAPKNVLYALALNLEKMNSNR